MNYVTSRKVPLLHCLRLWPITSKNYSAQ